MIRVILQVGGNRDWSSLAVNAKEQILPQLAVTTRQIYDRENDYFAARVRDQQSSSAVNEADRILGRGRSFQRSRLAAARSIQRNSSALVVQSYDASIGR
jgi:hypothetical protein